MQNDVKNSFLDSYDALKLKWNDLADQFARLFKPKILANQLTETEKNELNKLKSEIRKTISEFERFIADCKSAHIDQATNLQTKSQIKEIINESDQLLLELVSYHELLIQQLPEIDNYFKPANP